MSDDVSRLAIHNDAPVGQALIIRPRVLPTTAQFAIEQQLAWKLRNARGFLPNHYMVGDENERAAKILAGIEYARAVGIEPMIALQNTQVIDGKVGASALLIGALLRRSGYVIADDTDDVRSIVTVSKNGASAKGEFSMQDAVRAQLVKPNSGWQKYPRDMMYARALTQAARRGAQDAVLGMAYTAEELGGIEEEIAGVPVIEGEVVPAAASAVSEAAVVSPPPVTVIQPAPSTPSVEVPPDNASPGAGEQVPAEPAVTPPPPQPAPNPVPLAGASISRRMGLGRSIGPAPRRTNVVPAPQAAETPAKEPETPPQPTTSTEAVPSQPAPPDLTEEPVTGEPIDQGHVVFLNSLRDDLRTRAALLLRVNTILRNVDHALKSEATEEVPVKEPTALSDEGLGRLIDRDYPGRTLANLGEAELQNRLELVEANLAKKRALMTERGISE